MHSIQFNLFMDLNMLMDPKNLLASEDTLKKIETISRRHFSDENELSESYLFILDSLKEDDYKRLRAFTGKSSTGTYLHTLINRLAIDFRRRKYGRRRIPKMVATLGAWAEAVYKYVCWQKFSFDDAFDFLLVEGLYNGAYEEYVKAVEPIRQAPCPENPKFISNNDSFGDSARDDTNNNPLDTLIEKLDREKKITAVTVIRQVTNELTEQEQLLIKLVYGSDLSVAKAARTITMDPQKARKLLKKILVKFRERLLAEGIRE